MMKTDFALSGLGPDFLWTIVIVAAAILANIAISAILRGPGWLSRETKLRASVFWRNFSLLIAIISLILTLAAGELHAALADQRGIAFGLTREIGRAHV